MITDVTGVAASGPTGLTGALVGTGTQQGLGKEEFLKLLVTQLQNQDPLNPMDGQEMAVQLAQFSSVEQLISLNDAMEAQALASLGMGEAVTQSLAASMLGSTVIATGDQVLIPGDGSVTFELPPGGADATIHIFDANGVELESEALGLVSGGRQVVQLGSGITNLPAGTYRYEIEATDASGDPVAVRTLMSAVVDGLRFATDGVRLLAGDLEFKMADVIEVGVTP